jgi:hypothetical protein
MVTTSAHKWLVSMGCCLFAVSGLTSQPRVPPPKGAGNDPAFQIGDVRVPPLNEEQLRALITPEQLQQLFSQMEKEQERRMREAQRKSVALSEWLHWRWLLYGLLAAGGLGGLWGAKQVLTKKSSPVADPPKRREERLGLGADGRDGVWQREVPPWEK